MTREQLCAMARDLLRARHDAGVLLRALSADAWPNLLATVAELDPAAARGLLAEAIVSEPAPLLAGAVRFLASRPQVLRAYLAATIRGEEEGTAIPATFEECCQTRFKAGVREAAARVVAEANAVRLLAGGDDGDAAVRLLTAQIARNETLAVGGQI